MKDKEKNGIYIEILKNTNIMTDCENDLQEIVELGELTDETIKLHYYYEDFDSITIGYDLYYQMEDLLFDKVGYGGVVEWRLSINPIINGETIDYDCIKVLTDDGIIDTPLWKTIVRNIRLEELGL